MYISKFNFYSMHQRAPLGWEMLWDMVGFGLTLFIGYSLRRQEISNHFAGS